MSIKIDCSSIITPKTKQGCQENTIFNSQTQRALNRKAKAEFTLREFTLTLFNKYRLWDKEMKI